MVYVTKILLDCHKMAHTYADDIANLLTVKLEECDGPGNFGNIINPNSASSTANNPCVPGPTNSHIGLGNAFPKCKEHF